MSYTGARRRPPGGKHRLGRPRRPSRAETLTGVMLAAPLIPLAVAAVPLIADAPGTQAADSSVLGFAATLSLLACLAVTPLTRVAKVHGAARYRKWYGLQAFELGLAGLVIAVTAGPGTGHAAQWTGTVIVAVLAPAALISNEASTRTLGPVWKTWQRRSAWTAWGAVAVHLAVLRAWPAEMFYLAASAPLLAARLPAARKGLPRWRRSSYPGLTRRAGAAAAVAVFAAGMGGLAVMELAACVHAIRIA
jgi:DMSO/TMAO reductase YedYZ heme-binding membrane subunit